MPFTADEISTAGKLALDFNLANKPIDQITTARPLISFLTKKQKTFPGGKQYITEQLMTAYGSNFQWFYGDQGVTYNKRSPIDLSQFPWRGAHDGFTLNEDQLAQNGVTMTDGPPKQNTGAERLQLTNLLETQTDALRLGFEQKFDYELHLDGTQSSEALAGLDLLISTTPTSGVVGGIDRATNTWWRNNVSTGISTGTAGNLISTMEQVWRACTRNGGQAPDYILVGETFLDAFRKDAASQIQRFLTNGNRATLDPSVSDLQFKGVPLVWDPVFADLDAALSPSVPWQKRCYFINSNWIRLRPIEGHNMVTRKPPRVYNRYAYYWGLTWKGAMTLSKANAHAVISVA